MAPRGSDPSVDARSAASEASAADPSSARTRTGSEAPSEVASARPARPWLRRMALGASLGALAAAAVPVAVVAPFVRDDLRLDRIVRAVALDWRDFGEDRARTRLEYELDRQSIGLQVGDDDCRLSEEGRLRRVACAWSVVLEIPGTELTVPLSFQSSAVLGPDGSLR